MDTAKKVPENTSHDTLGVILPTVNSKVGQEILRQEAKGQQSFLASDTLPIDMLSTHKAILEEVGVVFGDVVEGDPLFQYAELPSGWRKRACEDTSIRSCLVDNQGRKRAYIIYEPIFYKRNARLWLISRFSYRYDQKREEKENLAVSEVIDHDGTVLYSTEPLELPEIEKEEERYKLYVKAQGLAQEWLEHYPKWSNPGAYWD